MTVKFTDIKKSYLLKGFVCRRSAVRLIRSERICHLNIYGVIFIHHKIRYSPDDQICPVPSQTFEKTMYSFN